MKRLSLPSPAKLNLFLHITQQRPDGYHELQTVFQLIDLADTLDIELLETPDIQIAGQDDIPLTDNLIYKAAKALQEQTQCTLGAAISIDKILPAGGGIGGGSSNAATTLLALNTLWDLGLSLDTLSEIGINLGADVPVFIKGYTAWAEGIGEKLTAIQTDNRWFIIVFPNISISTAKIFSDKALTRDAKICKIAAFLEDSSGKQFSNHCEPVVRKLYPEMDNAFNQLATIGKPKLTGTGACIFLEYATQEQAQAALIAVEAINSKHEYQWQCFLSKGTEQSTAHKALFA